MPYVLKTLNDAHPIKVGLQLLQFKDDKLARYREFQLPIPFVKQDEPERYPLEQIKVPIQLLYSADDKYAKPDVSNKKQIHFVLTNMSLSHTLSYYLPTNSYLLNLYKSSYKQVKCKKRS